MSSENLVERSNFRDPELDKPKKSYVDEKPIFTNVQLKSSGFKDPELEKKKTQDEEKPAFAAVIKTGSTFRDPELEKLEKRKTMSEEQKPAFVVQLKQSGFRDPELDKQKRVQEDDKPAFAGVQLRSSTFKDPELEKAKRATIATSEAPVFAQVQLKNTSNADFEKSPGSSRKALNREDSNSRHSFFDTQLKKTGADLTDPVAPSSEEKVEAPVFAAVKLKNVERERPKTIAVSDMSAIPTEIPRKTFGKTEPAFERREAEKPAFVGMSLKKVELVEDKDKEREPEETKIPMPSLKKVELAESEKSDETASVEKSPEIAPAFAAVKLKSAANKSPEIEKEKAPGNENRMSFADAVVALKKTSQAELIPKSTEKKEEIPAFVGVKLKKLSEQVKNKEEEQPRKGLSKTRRLPSEDNLKAQYAERTDDGPAPVLPIGNQKQVQKAASFTKRTSEWDAPKVKQVEAGEEGEEAGGEEGGDQTADPDQE